MEHELKDQPFFKRLPLTIVTQVFKYGFLVVKKLEPVFNFVVVKLVQAEEVVARFHDPEICKFVLGVLLVLAGGMLPVTISCYFAFLIAGGEDILSSWEKFKRSWQQTKEEFKKDKRLMKKVDKNKDGEVQNMELREALRRNTLRGDVLKTILLATDPINIKEIIAGCYKGTVAVLAALKMRLAAAFALSIKLGEFFEGIGRRNFRKPIHSFVDPDWQMWSDFILDGLAQGLALFITFWFNLIVMSVYTALKGSKMVVEHGLNVAAKYKILKQEFGPQARSNIGYAIAGVGFLMQAGAGFDAPWIIYLPLYPAFIVENLLSFYCSWSG